MFKVSAINFQLMLLRFGLKRFRQGFYYYKWLEYPLVFNNLKFANKCEYLDIGSGHSIFPLFVFLKRRFVKVNIVDDNSIINDSTQSYKNILKMKGFRKKNLDNFSIHEGNSDCKLNFPDNQFDRISCISVVEHMRDFGDSLTIQEIGRVLKPGGRAVITVPFDNANYVEDENAHGPGYFQRTYTPNEIQNRLVNAAGTLDVCKVVYFGERSLVLREKFFELNKLYWLMPLFSSFFWRICHSYKGSYRNYYEKQRDKKYVGVICIVLEKKGLKS